MFRSTLAAALVLTFVSLAAGDDKNTPTEVLARHIAGMKNSLAKDADKQKLQLEINKNNATAKKAFAEVEAKQKALDADPVKAIAAFAADNYSGLEWSPSKGDIAPQKFSKVSILKADEESILFKTALYARGGISGSGKTPQKCMVRIVGKNADAQKGKTIDLYGFYEVIEKAKGDEHLITLKPIAFTDDEIEQAKKAAEEIVANKRKR